MSSRERTFQQYNLDMPECEYTESGFPILLPCNISPSTVVSFNDAVGGVTNENGLVHFFLDDYRFERVWRYPQRYLDAIRRNGAAATPDFSMYSDMPLPMQQWNHYRSLRVGAYWQTMGLCVIPTLQWSDDRSYDFCFEGVPEESTVAVSAVGCCRGAHERLLWSRGMNEAINRLHPKKVILYGSVPDFDFPCEVATFSNDTVERARNGRKRKQQRQQDVNKQGDQQASI